ncbi:MAG: two-component system response regulator [Desulfarculaceae bacterium]|nr:two-component system response regulator [Desulfarculaceae bacterium]
MKSLEECSVLVVDDTEANVDILVDALGDLYEIMVAMDGESALETVEEEPPDLILLDIMMPGMDGYEVCGRLQADPRFRSIPIIFLTALTEVENKTKGFELGAVDYITKPFEVREVQARVHNHLDLKMHRDHLDQLVAMRTREVEVTQDITIHSLASLAETRDNETGKHILRTQRYVRALASRLSDHPKFAEALRGDTVELLFKSTPLHDIGKVGVPDAILLKPGKLDDGEFTVMKSHCELGFQALLKAEEVFDLEERPSFLSHAKDIAYTHHEKWDGSGYPQGLAGEDIPVSGRLMAVADVYDALISKRVYKPPFSHEQAVQIIGDGRGTHFDPDIVDTFLEMHQEFADIAKEFEDQD